MDRRWWSYPKSNRPWLKKTVYDVKDELKMKYTIRECVEEDALTLQNISCKTYSDTYEHLNSPSNMKAYLEKAFDFEKLSDELSNSNIIFYFIYADGELSGYLKLNEYTTQTDVNDPKSLEIERIYVKKEVQGNGLGGVLLHKAIDIATMRGKSYIWLSAWEENEKALAFYHKNGFDISGKRFFMMGNEKQNDFIMHKALL